jgi:hypothetical protein
MKERFDECSVGKLSEAEKRPGSITEVREGKTVIIIPQAPEYTLSIDNIGIGITATGYSARRLGGFKL